MSLSEYKHYISNHKKYTDFNTLGLYRSLTENEKLSIDDKIEIRAFAHKYFLKSFNFLQLKDPITFIEVSNLGLYLNKSQLDAEWEKLKINQQKILEDKRIKHRSFGSYSKHNCGYEDCYLNGVMIKQGSWLAESHMRFNTDNNKNQRFEKSLELKKQRKSIHKIINNELDLDH